MAIEIPAEIFNVRKWQCKVRSNRNVATFIKELVLELPQGEEVPFRAGGYIQIECPPHEVHFKNFEVEEQFREDWDKYKLWDLSSKCTENVERALLDGQLPRRKRCDHVERADRDPAASGTQGETPPGIMSSYIFGLKPGDDVTISGPFGEFFAKDTDAEMVFIGGGAGMAPMRSHIFDQFYRIHTKRKVSFWYRRTESARGVLR